MKNRYKASDLFLVIVFAILLFIPCILFLNTLNNYKLPESENGPQQHTFSATVKKYENLLSDSLTLKTELIRSYYYVKTKILKEISITPSVIQGTEEWLYYSGSGDGYPIESFTGQQILADTSLLKIKLNLEAQERWLRKRNIDFYIIMCPNKQTIYSEFFPYKKGITVADQIMSYLKSNSNLKIIDLRETMIKAKDNKHLLYYKADSHWNQYGGFIAYTEIINQLSLVYPELKPLQLKDYNISFKETEGGDLAKMVNLQKDFKDHEYDFDLKDTTTLPKKNIVMFHDSYYWLIKPFLANHFILTERPHQWNSFDYNVIDEVKPEIVFYEVVERYLTAFSRENPAEIKDTLINK
ncbi:alginate O-acetyltransferase AlgJ [Sporocytophaga myxococcoides]|uniref:Alginate O-acetyltransferase AlgJ n=1 Tax=Sporocytophaga myxococcoides TaxID=153721 RepID=A0A098LLZ2_9BACT|nr:hypothetical protein [Sporocytophaga myxococcoides]GAL87163.1 alginate O-acetyltransferase AlgJ [Sporocytophaga myxococcoides]